MNILITSHESLLPMVGGNRKAMYSSARILSELGHNVTFISWGEEQSYTKYLAKIKVIHRMTKTSNDVYKQFGANTSLPDLIYQIGSELGIPQILSLLSRGPVAPSLFDIDLNNFDLIIKEGPDMNSLINGGHESIPKVYRLHWLGLPTYVRNLNNWKEFTRPEKIDNLFLPLSIKKFIDYIVTNIELSTLESGNILTVSTMDEAKAIQHKPDISHLKTVTLPIISDDRNLEKCKKSMEFFEARPYVIFFSTQNRSSEFAVLYIYRLSKLMPSINFVIVGKINVNQNIPTNTPNYKILGYLAESEFYDLIKNATAIIFPKIYGHGLQMKLVESFRFHKPIITTSPLYNELPDLREGDDIIVEDDPETFGHAIEQVLDSDGLQRKLNYNSKKYYESHLSPEAHKNGLRNYLEKVISTGV